MKEKICMNCKHWSAEDGEIIGMCNNAFVNVGRGDTCKSFDEYKKVTKMGLVKQVNQLYRDGKDGDKIVVKYDGEVLGEYEVMPLSIDMKTPEDWIRGIILFDVEWKARDLNNVEVELIKK